MDNWNEITPTTLMDLTPAPEAATAKLAELAAARAPALPPLGVEPQTAADAQRRLDVLTKDATWRDKYLAGHAAERRELARLNELIAGGDPVADVLAGAVPPPGDLEITTDEQISRRDLAQVIQEHRDLGISDEASNEIIRGLPQSPENIAKAKIMLNQRQGDPEWTKRLLAGGMTERRELRLISGIIAGEAA